MMSGMTAYYTPCLRVPVSPRLNPTPGSPDPDAGQSEERGVEHGLTPLTLHHSGIQGHNSGSDQHQPNNITEIFHLLSLFLLHHELHLFHGIHFLFLLHGKTSLTQLLSKKLFQGFSGLCGFPGVLKSDHLGKVK